MIKFIEVEKQHEIGNGILDFLVKVVGTENGAEYSKEKEKKKTTMWLFLLT